MRAAHVDPSLPDDTLAATTGGDVALNPRAALLGAEELAAVCRHELAHSVHQRTAASVDDGPRARAHAESVAQRAERGGAVGASELLRPAPRVLTYEGTSYGSFPRVWVGTTGIIGEVVVDGVPIRVFRSYTNLKIIASPEHVEFECNPKHRDSRPLRELVKRMTAVGEQVARINAMLPAGAAERVSLVAIVANESTRYALTDAGKGIVVLSEADADDAAHEAAHALFEFHAGSSATPKRAPTGLALRVADLFDRLNATKLVPQPSGRFDVRRAKPTGKATGDTMPAGMAMVLDTLWAAIPGGHPGDNPSELFASALALFDRNPVLFEAIGAYYEKQDPALKPLRAELVTLLAAAADPAKQKWLAALGKPAQAKAERLIGGLGSASTVGANTTANATLLALVDPTKLRQAASIPACPPPKPKRKR